MSSTFSVKIDLLWEDQRFLYLKDSRKGIQKLNEIEGIDISRETVRKDLRQHNLIDEMRHAPKHRSRRERMPMVGMMSQHDTSEHDWLEGRGPEIKLIASIGDANNGVPYALFVEADGTLLKR